MNIVCRISFLSLLVLCTQTEPIHKHWEGDRGSSDFGIQSVKELLDGIKDTLKNAHTPEFQFLVKDIASDCGKGNDPVTLTSFKLSPDYIPVPGNVTVSADVNIKQDLLSPLTLKVDMKKSQFGIHIRVPCVDNVGSCTYDDICQFMPNANKQDNDACPDDLVKLKLPCKCPVKKDLYSVEGLQFPIEKPDVNLPLDGDYDIEARLSHNGVELACIDVKIEVKTN